MNFTPFFAQLNEWKDTAKSLLETHKQRLDGLDWDKEMTEMINDDDYSVYQAGDFEEFWKLSRRIQGWLHEDTTALRDALLETQNIVMSVGQYQFKRLKEEVQKRSIDDVPTLMCIECGKFFVSQTKNLEHDCKGTTKCGNCKQDCKTHERLEAHIRQRKCFKQFKCEHCPEYKGTNSEEMWKRHIISKEHKKAIGILQDLYVCVPCDYQNRHKYRYDDHCLTKRHREKVGSTE